MVQDTLLKNATSDNSAQILREHLAAAQLNYEAQIPHALERILQTHRALKANGGTTELVDLHRQAHNLSGSAGTYGFDQLGTRARELERLLQPLLTDSSDRSARVNGALASIKTYVDQLVDAATAAPALTVPSVLTTSAAAHPPGSDPAKNPERLVFVVGESEAVTGELTGQIAHFGYQVRSFVNLAEARSALVDERPAAIIADADSADSDAAVNSARSAEAGTVFPPLIYISEHGDMQARLRAVRAGGSSYFTRPIDIGEIVDKLDVMASDESTTPYRVLIVDDEASIAAFCAAALKCAGMVPRVVTDPMQVMQTLTDFRPDLILMDVYMPACTGLELATVIRQQADFISIPIVFLSAETNPDKQMAAMSSGADDFLTKPIQPEFLASAVATRAQRSRALRSFMIRDSLTGLLNHTTTKEQLALELLRARRSGAALSFAMFDIDRFKTINDSYGHLTGDRVIKGLSRLLLQRLRKTDIIGRYGGEEFAAILVDTNAETAMHVLDEIRSGFSKIRQYAPHGEFTVTFSGGVAQFPTCADAASLHDAADRALYEAKRLGRDRLVLAH